MNQTSSDLDANGGGSRIMGERTSNLIKGLGAYFAAVLVNVSLIIVLTLGEKAFETTGWMFYLVISLLFLIFYSAATTRTAGGSISYRLKQIVKRLFDVIVVASSLFFFMPLIILLSLAIRIESPGPILFRSKRIGQFGKPIELYKFRTMYLSPKGQAVTKVGGVLRRFSLNELPELINILNGELSLVGPGPRYPEDLDETLDSERKILSVRPGMTGLWQISVPLERDMVSLDLQYIQNWTLVLDVKILFKSVLVAFQDAKSA